MINSFFKLAVHYLYSNKNRMITYSYNIYNMYGLHHVKKKNNFKIQKRT